MCVALVLWAFDSTWGTRITTATKILLPSASDQLAHSVSPGEPGACVLQALDHCKSSHLGLKVML